jgi:hypothetical protein
MAGFADQVVALKAAQLEAGQAHCGLEEAQAAASQAAEALDAAASQVAEALASIARACPIPGRPDLDPRCPSLRTVGGPSGRCCEGSAADRLPALRLFLRGSRSRATTAARHRSRRGARSVRLPTGHPDDRRASLTLGLPPPSSTSRKMLSWPS